MYKPRVTKKSLQEELAQKEEKIRHLKRIIENESAYADVIAMSLGALSMAYGVAATYMYNDMRINALAARAADQLEAAKNKPAVANWVLKGLSFVADGITFYVAPLDGTQNVLKNAALNLRGAERITSETFTGKVAISYRLPVIGIVDTVGEVVHVENSTIRAAAITITNKLTFWMQVEGVKRLFTLNANGTLYHGPNFAYSVTGSVYAEIDRSRCDLGNGCTKIHEPGHNSNRPVGFHISKIEMNK